MTPQLAVDHLYGVAAILLSTCRRVAGLCGVGPFVILWVMS